MDKEERLELYDKAISKWGMRPQVDMVFEECGELINALAKWLRGRGNGEEVITELADVQIMIEQMTSIFGKDKFDAEVERKLIRLKERLNK